MQAGKAAALDARDSLNSHDVDDTPAHTLACSHISFARTHAAQVHELRSVFTAYLEQLQGMSGHEMEQLMVKALEASDMLDSVVTLQKVGHAAEDRSRCRR